MKPGLLCIRPVQMVAVPIPRSLGECLHHPSTHRNGISLQLLPREDRLADLLHPTWSEREEQPVPGCHVAFRLGVGKLPCLERPLQLPVIDAGGCRIHELGLAGHRVVVRNRAQVPLLVGGGVKFQDLEGPLHGVDPSRPERFTPRSFWLDGLLAGSGGIHHGIDALGLVRCDYFPVKTEIGGKEGLLFQVCGVTHRIHGVDIRRGRGSHQR